MAKVGILYDPHYHEHYAPYPHPENPGRLESIFNAFQADGAWARQVKFEGRPATDQEIRLNHSADYLAQVEISSRQEFDQLDPDTYTCAHSAQTARLAVGGLLDLTSAALKGEVASGFALVRPPGHHAEENRAAGFCIYNNIALAARMALQSQGIKKVLIVDWDLHHGNGTQWSFYDRSEVLYFSTHQYPYYPGTGSMSQVGEGAGLGKTVNVPLPAGMGDEEYLAVFDQVLLPIAEHYAPDLVLVSAGFDPYEKDPLGGMKVTPQGFARLTDRLLYLAGRSAKGRIILVLEGGYNLDGLGVCAVSCLHRLEAGEAPAPSEPSPAGEYISGVIRKVLEIQRQYWPI